MISWSTTFVIVFGVLSSLIIADDPCRFIHSGKGVIDLTTLGRNDGKAAYPDVIPQTGSNYKYSYNPCKPFSEGTGDCTNAAVCQVSLDGVLTFLVGTQESAEWSAGDGMGDYPSVSYKSGPKRAIVQLVCSTDGTNRFEALGELPINVYQFRLTHKCACWNGCGDTPPPPPQKNCSINGNVYTSDKQIIQSFPFRVAINPPQPSPPDSSYAIVDTDSRVIELNLVNIDSIPSAVFCLSELKVLSLQHTTGISISSEIIRLAPFLKSFTILSNSQPVVLPPEFFQLSLLSTLSIVNCGLETLSEDIGKLTQLTELTLDQNQLITLPVALSKMPFLANLSINGNQRLSSLDALSGSMSLTTLRASNCTVNHLPANISNLHTIELNGNQLTILDGIETITSPICNLLSFGNNKIGGIPTNSLIIINTVLNFNLSGNLLTTLPDSLYEIKNLEVFDIRNNRFHEKESEWIQGVFRPTNTTLLM